jgi:NADH dehydrogenase FAD-containing subunit
MIRYEPTFGDNFLQAKVVKVDLKDKKVFVDSGECITYSHLVISVGSVGTYPGFIGSGTVAEGVKELNKISSQVGDFLFKS